MNFVLLILVCLVVGVVLSAAVRRVQMRNTRLALADDLAGSILAAAPDGANRQQLADILKSWDQLSATRQEALLAHLKAHPRLEGADLTDEATRTRLFQELLGISLSKSPEK